MRNFSLAPGTTQTIKGVSSGPESVRYARAAGYTHLGFRVFQGVSDPSHPLQSKGPVWRETRDAIVSEGVTPWEIEVVMITPATHVEDFRAGVASAAELGGRYLVVGMNDSDTSRATDKFSALCALTEEHGMGVVLEYFAYSTTRSLAEACELVMNSRAGNAGVLIDTYHFARAGDTTDALARTVELLPYVQISDASASCPGDLEAIKHESRNSRLFPGEGGLDLMGLINALSDDCLISIEIINPDRCTELGPQEHARRAREAMSTLLNR